MSSQKKVKPIVNLTKKGYTGFIEAFRAKMETHVHKTFNTQGIPDEFYNGCENIIKECLRDSTGFDPDIKISKEDYEKKYEQRKKLLAREGVSNYEKYNKRARQLKREKFPGVSTTILYNTPMPELEKMFGAPTSVLKT